MQYEFYIQGMQRPIISEEEVSPFPNQIGWVIVTDTSGYKWSFNMSAVVAVKKNPE